ncbi:MAG: hypothetical protein WCP33_07095 [Deltaproteobacteria bacterium]
MPDTSTSKDSTGGVTHTTNSTQEFKATLQCWSEKPASGISLKLHIFAHTYEEKASEEKEVFVKTLQADNISVDRANNVIVKLDSASFTKSKTTPPPSKSKKGKSKSTPEKRSGQVYDGWVLQVLQNGKVIDTVFSNANQDLKKAYESSVKKS